MRAAGSQRNSRSRATRMRRPRSRCCATRVGVRARPRVETPRRTRLPAVARRNLSTGGTSLAHRMRRRSPLPRTAPPAGSSAGPLRAPLPPTVASAAPAGGFRWGLTPQDSAATPPSARPVDFAASPARTEPEARQAPNRRPARIEPGPAAHPEAHPAAASSSDPFLPADPHVPIVPPDLPVGRRPTCHRMPGRPASIRCLRAGTDRRATGLVRRPAARPGASHRAVFAGAAGRTDRAARLPPHLPATRARRTRPSRHRGRSDPAQPCRRADPAAHALHAATAHREDDDSPLAALFRERERHLPETELIVQRPSAHRCVRCRHLRRVRHFRARDIRVRHCRASRPSVTTAQPTPDAHRQRAGAAGRSAGNKKLLLWGGGALLAVLALIGLFFLGTKLPELFGSAPAPASDTQPTRTRPPRSARAPARVRRRAPARARHR